VSRAIALTGAFLLLGPPASAFSGSPGEQPPVGSFTSLTGQVFAVHEGRPGRTAIRLNDPVHFHEVIQTLSQSRARAWLRDDSVLTVGEHSRIRVDEHLVDPSRDVRQVVVALAQGRVRAFVGKVFAGAGSKFEVHTPTAVTAARGTDFVVWLEEPDEAASAEEADTELGPSRPISGRPVQWLPATGLANIGHHGDVTFRTEEGMVLVRPGQFSIAHPGLPPSSPAPIGMVAPVAVSHAIAGMTDSTRLQPDDPGYKRLRTMPGNLGTIKSSLRSGDLKIVGATPPSRVSPVLAADQFGLPSVSVHEPRPKTIEVESAGLSFHKAPLPPVSVSPR
jgi:hypothetical protein